MTISVDRSPPRATAPAALERVATIVTPDAILRWHSKLIAAKWTYPNKRVGRPALMTTIKARIVRMATDNPSWSDCRIQDELKSLGHEVASSTIANVLKANGIQLAPNRLSSWRTLLRAPWQQFAATDFFSAEVWTPFGLRTYHVLLVIDRSTRRVHLAGITRNPHEGFMGQVARALTDVFDGFQAKHRFLICDRDAKFTAQFCKILGDAEVNVIRTTKLAPNYNAYAERFVRSIKSECLSRMMLFGEAGLLRAVTESLEHYNRERPHQGIGNEVIEGTGAVGTGPVQCSERLGGILKSYRRAA